MPHPGSRSRFGRLPPWVRAPLSYVVALPVIDSASVWTLVLAMYFGLQGGALLRRRRETQT